MILLWFPVPAYNHLMNKTIFGFIAFCLISSVFAENLAAKTETAYSKASGYTGLKKSLLYQALGSTKRYRRLV